MTPLAVGGSRSDGTIVLRVNNAAMFTEVDWAGAQRTAVEHCRAWDYSDAQAFGGILHTCTAPGGCGCNADRIERTYQCIDGD